MISEKEITAWVTDKAGERHRLIAEAIEALRPYLKADGGDCELISIDGDLVTVRLSGACVGCQLSGATLNGLQERLIDKLGFFLRIVQAPTMPGSARPVQLQHR